MRNLILVGMNPRTRSAIPWDADAEIWTLNEAPHNEWLRRYDVLFQLHPRWDWQRTNNIADPNHPHYICAHDGAMCFYCHGVGQFSLNGEIKTCPHCDEGIYQLPAHRAGKKIIMQDHNYDVPGCIRLPIEALTRVYSQGVPYFTSTLAHMLVAAYSLGYADIKLYGWEMESGTEYEHQRACAEYWIGYGRAKGLCIEAPGSRILKGEHYAYTSWMQGYRSRLGIRIGVLQQQLTRAQAEAIKSEGALAAIMPFKNVPELTPAFEAHFDDHYKKKNMVSFLNGTIKELENAIAIYDAYYGHEDGAEPEGVKENIGLIYQLG